MPASGECVGGGLKHYISRPWPGSRPMCLAAWLVGLNMVHSSNNIFSSTSL